MVLTSWEKGPFVFVRRSMCLYRSEIPAPCFGDQQSKSLPEWRNRVQQTAKSPLLARQIGSLRAGTKPRGCRVVARLRRAHHGRTCPLIGVKRSRTGTSPASIDRHWHALTVRSLPADPAPSDPNPPPVRSCRLFLFLCPVPMPCSCACRFLWSILGGTERIAKMTTEPDQVTFAIKPPFTIVCREDGSWWIETIEGPSLEVESEEQGQELIRELVDNPEAALVRYLSAITGLAAADVVAPTLAPMR